MARHVWSVLCSRSIIDRESNNLSLFDVIERVSITEDLATLEAKKAENPDSGIAIEYDVASLWVRSDPDVPEAVTGRIKIVTPTGKETVTPNYFINLMGQARRFRQRAHLIGFPYDGLGRYWIKVEYDAPGGAQVVAEIPVEVVHGDEAAQPQVLKLPE